MQCMMSITKVAGTTLTMAGSSGEYSLDIAYIKNSNGTPAKISDIKIGGQVHLKMNNQGAVVLANYIQPQADLRKSIDPNVIVQNRIGKMQPVSLLWSQDQSKRGLESMFDSFRKIPEGPSNLILALIVAIIDHSIIYSKFDLLKGIYKEMYDNYAILLPESDSIFTVIQNIVEIAEKNDSKLEKFNSIDSVYANSISELTRLIKNMIKIAATKEYYQRKYEHFRLTKSLEEILATVESLAGTIDLQDIIFFLDFYGVHLVIVKNDAQNLMTLDNNSKHLIYLYENSKNNETECYFPMYTYEDIILQRTVKPEEFNEILFFLKADEHRLSYDKIQKMLMEIQEKTQEKINLDRIFKELNNVVNPTGEYSVTKNCLESLEHKDGALSLLGEYLCSACNTFKENAKLDCGHTCCKACLELGTDDKIVCRNCMFRSTQNERVRELLA